MFRQINKTIIAILHLKNALHVVLCTKKLHFLARTGVRKISSVACGFSPFKIHFSDYTERLISRINEVYVFSIKYRYHGIGGGSSDWQLPLLQRGSHKLFACWVNFHVFFLSSAVFFAAVFQN